MDKRRRGGKEEEGKRGGRETPSLKNNFSQRLKANKARNSVHQTACRAY